MNEQSSRERIVTKWAVNTYYSE